MSDAEWGGVCALLAIVGAGMFWWGYSMGRMTAAIERNMAEIDATWGRIEAKLAKRKGERTNTGPEDRP